MFFDIIFILLFAFAAFKGYTKGLILQLASLAALILGIYGAIKFSSYLSTYLIENYHLKPDVVPLVSFALIFIAIVILIHLLGKFLEKIADLTALGFINRILGAVFNMVKYALLISVFLVILNNINRKVTFLPQKQLKSSILYYPLTVLTPLLYPYLRYNFIPVKKEQTQPDNEIQV
jgi:membrane protein required for colicin V production